ncbi:type I-E CRISPR-associated protein Cas5/CasD [Oceanimonas doudoroffii]|nr:type I-E CRISPR-associated protein Cas5/CasD [Oceanimonas doudoroffii]
MQYLVFRLYGPMASWGEAAVGGDRPSGLTPSRSAVLGLLGAALGIKRDDVSRLDALRAEVGIAVKAYSCGSLMRDYHTAQVPSQDRKRTFYSRKDELSVEKEKLNTVLSSRDYRSDGYWVVAVWLWQESEFTLDMLEAALKKPAFTPYLGRKACPLAVPVTPRLVAFELKEALDTSFPPILFSHEQDRRWLGLGNTVTYLWQGTADDLGEYEGVQSCQVWDEPISREPWQFSARQVHQLTLVEE